jgi:hypothetical protein
VHDRDGGSLEDANQKLLNSADKNHFQQFLDQKMEDFNPNPNQNSLHDNRRRNTHASEHFPQNPHRQRGA